MPRAIKINLKNMNCNHKEITTKTAYDGDESYDIDVCLDCGEELSLEELNKLKNI